MVEPITDTFGGLSACRNRILRETLHVGQVALEVARDRLWLSLTSTAHLPLKRWIHIVGTLDGARGLPR